MSMIAPTDPEPAVCLAARASALRLKKELVLRLNSHDPGGRKLAREALAALGEP